MMMKISNDITTGEKIYYGAFFFVFLTSGLPMLANADTYNAKMNQFGILLGDYKLYNVDSMPWRLRHKLIQDVSAFGAGIVATLLGSPIPPMLVTITTFDLLGAVTSGIVVFRTQLKAEWMPVIVHCVVGLWGLTICVNRHQSSRQ
jgi:hypothetical protein